MKQAILRSLGIGLLTMAVVGMAALVRTTVFCPERRGVRAIDGTQLILADGFRTARPGDAIYACRAPHCVGPFCHEDETCQCAPLALGAAAVGARLGGECVVDQLQPARTDTAGACRHARCDEHLDP